MPAQRVIVGPDGQAAEVSTTGGVAVNVRPTPACDLTQVEVEQRKLFGGVLTDSSGSSDLTIDGSSTPVRFTVRAPTDHVAWVQEIRLVFHSSNMRIDNNESRRFGPVSSPGLTNGLLLQAVQGGTVTEIFTSPVQVIGSFYRYARSQGGNGLNTAITNDSDAISGGVDFLMVSVWMPAPVGLFPGGLDEIRLTVQDDLTGLTLFEVQYAGWQEKVS